MNHGLAAAVVVLSLAAAAAAAFAAVPQTAGRSDKAAPTYSSGQVTRGRAAYGTACASCHGAKLQGSGAPPLAGASFSKRWLVPGRMADLREAIHRMPKQAPHSLSATTYADITAFILAANEPIPRATRAPTSTTAAPSAKASASAKPPMSAETVKAPVLPSAPARVAQTKSRGPSDADLLEARGDDWLTYNRDLPGTRYSTLSQIDASNASQLQPVCVLQTGETAGFQSSPLIYKGVGYASTVYSVFAFDAATCERMWVHTYKVTDTETLTTNRGVALYDGKIFRGTTDGHLIALDAGSGELLWDAHVTDSAKGAYVGSAPVAYNGRVYVGMAGGEYGIRGKIFAFDADTGKLLWKFNTVPTRGEPGYETWEKGTETGGGPSWTSFAFDPADDTLYVPVGNPSPDFGTHARPGRNLYTNSVVALDGSTGKLRWYVQQVPADDRDYDTAAPPVLYTLDGRRYLGVGSKDGNVYIYDRDTQALLGRAPVTTIKNIDVPLKFGKANKTRVCPGPLGGVEWFGPAYSPQAKALFVGTNDWCADIYLEKAPYKPGLMYMEGVTEFVPMSEQKGWLKALDAATGKELWSYAAPKPMLAGVTPTAGGVVLTGGADGYFLVFDAKDGRILYRFNTGGAIGGGVSTYRVGGRQYVAVAAGTRAAMPYGVLGAPTLVVFALPQQGSAH